MSGTAYHLLLIHRRLDDEIRRHQKMRWPDILRIQRLKKLKLAVKDRLHRLALGRRTLLPA